jgi:UDP-N-acetylglucosamine 4,6-dehydratase
MNIMVLARAIAPDCEVEEIGIWPGEKVHEVLISEDEARHTLELDDMFVIQPAHPWWTDDNWQEGRPLPEGFRYGSDNNSQWLTVEALRRLVGELA